MSKPLAPLYSYIQIGDSKNVTKEAAEYAKRRLREHLPRPYVHQPQAPIMQTTFVVFYNTSKEEQARRGAIRKPGVLSTVADLPPELAAKTRGRDLFRTIAFTDPKGSANVAKNYLPRGKL